MTPLLGHYSTGLDLATASPDPVLCCLLCLYILGFLNFFVNAVINTKYVMLSPTSAFCFLPFESAYTSAFTLFEICCFYE